MRTLISFGCSHTAKAEIDAPRTPECKERLPIRKKLLITMECDLKNHAVCGCGNSWILKSFIERIKYAVSEKEDVVVHIGFTEQVETMSWDRERFFMELLHC